MTRCSSHEQTKLWKLIVPASMLKEACLHSWKAKTERDCSIPVFGPENGRVEFFSLEILQSRSSLQSLGSLQLLSPCRKKMLDEPLSYLNLRLPVSAHMASLRSPLRPVICRLCWETPPRFQHQVLWPLKPDAKMMALSIQH